MSLALRYLKINCLKVQVFFLRDCIGFKTRLNHIANKLPYSISRLSSKRKSKGSDAGGSEHSFSQQEPVLKVDNEVGNRLIE